MKTYQVVFSVVLFVVLCGAWFAVGFIYRDTRFPQKPTEIISSDQIRICEEKGGEYSISKWGGEYEESCRTKMREIDL